MPRNKLVDLVENNNCVIGNLLNPMNISLDDAKAPQHAFCLLHLRVLTEDLYKMMQ